MVTGFKTEEGKNVRALGKKEMCKSCTGSKGVGFFWIQTQSRRSWTPVASEIFKNYSLSPNGL